MIPESTQIQRPGRRAAYPLRTLGSLLGLRRLLCHRRKAMGASMSTDVPTASTFSDEPTGESGEITGFSGPVLPLRTGTRRASRMIEQA